MSVKGRKRIDNSKILLIKEMRKTHTAQEVADAFCVSSSSVRKLCPQYGYRNQPNEYLQTEQFKLRMGLEEKAMLKELLFLLDPYVI